MGSCRPFSLLLCDRYIGLSTWKEVIQDYEWVEISQRKMTELKDAVPDVVLRLDGAETALYIDGAISSSCQDALQSPKTQRKVSALQ